MKKDLTWILLGLSATGVAASGVVACSSNKADGSGGAGSTSGHGTTSHNCGTHCGATTSGPNCATDCSSSTACATCATCAAGCSCVGPTQDAPSVQPMQIAADAPAATGGTIVDGTYWLTATNVYTGPGGATGPIGSASAGTETLTGGTWAETTTDGTGTHTSSGTFTVNGSGITLAATCPLSFSLPGTYTATPTEVRFYLVGEEGVYTLH